MPVAFMLVLLAGLGLRVPQLAVRPMHHDEANQAYRFGVLLEEGVYEYDSDDHHGPTLYYLTLPVAWFSGARTFAETSESTYRILPVFFGMLLIAGIPMLRNGIGCGAVLGAAFFTAISPAMAYYSRFYIQETLLVFFTFLMIAGGWHAWRSGSRIWAVTCGLAAGLMFATKETAVITYAALLGAAVLSAVVTRRIHLPIKAVLVAAGSAVLVAFILYSSFFTNLDGPLESIVAFKGYLARGSGVDTDHVHPWHYFLRMLTFYRLDGGPVWSEALIFVPGLLGCIFIILKRLPDSCNCGLARFLMFYTLLLTMAYSSIAYKTPWCILSFLHGWILLAGIGTASLLHWIRDAVPHGYVRIRGTRMQLNAPARWIQLAIILVLIGPTAATCRLAHRSVFRYAADYRNPYVYAHTVPDFKNLVQRIEALKAVSPAGNGMYIQVVADPKAMWPLPFYLRDYPNTGYWTNADSIPDTPQPDIIITSTDFEPNPDDYQSEYYGLRADTLLTIHIRRPLWERFIETRR